ncbi:hypothetical protein KY339_01425, partial [Candidatus Woesearchaeota archaeon]|nr:hypothetical protein [Candidatus Woesearchaeota archaeon]
KSAYSNIEPYNKKWKFPKQDFFLLDKFVQGLESKNWIYAEVMRDARSPIPDIKENDPSDLMPYEGDKLEDLERAIQNAEIRITSAKRVVHFGSVTHGEILSQELYEAGWDWSYSE